MPKAKFKTSKSGCVDPESSDDELGAFWSTSSMASKSHLSQVNTTEEDYNVNVPSISGRELPDLCQIFPSGLFSPSKKSQAENKIHEPSEIFGSLENNPFKDDVSFLELSSQSQFLPENLSLNETEVSKNGALSDGVSLQCALCQELFFQSRDLVVPRIEDKNENQYQCGKCQPRPGQTDSQQGFFLLNSHENSNNHGKFPETSGHLSKLKIGLLSFSRKEFQNFFCQSSEVKDNRQSHMEENKFFSQSSNSNLKNHMLIHTNESQYKYDFCPKRSGQPSDRKRRIQTHIGENPFKDEKCHNTFSISSDLKIRMQTHAGDKPFYCKICQKSFNRLNHLNRHMRTHTGERPFQCEKCQKSFTQSGHLKGHMQTHTGEKPFQCKKCQKSFSHSTSLINHMRTHTGEKPFQCEKCQKSFTQSGHLKGHMRTHTGAMPFQCEKCQKSFSHLSNLKEHMRSHTGEKPFHCETCQKSFSRSSKLKEHMRTHTGEKPFQCETCQKSFAQSSGLRKHMRTHTAKSHFNVKHVINPFTI